MLTLTFPKRLAIEEATSIEIADIILVVKKSDPNFPSRRLNFDLKKYVTHDLSTALALDILVVYQVIDHIQWSKT